MHHNNWEHVPKLYLKNKNGSITQKIGDKIGLGKNELHNPIRQIIQL